jgi:hypothetical protein
MQDHQSKEKQKMKKEPKIIPPGKLVVNAGPYLKNLGAIPEVMKRHVLPARTEQKASNSMVKNTGPSRSGQGNLKDRTRSHFAPARREVHPSEALQITPISNADRQSVDPNGSKTKKWYRKGKYDLTI